MRIPLRGALVASLVAFASQAAFAFCTNPSAIGVARVLELDTSRGLEVGYNGFRHRLPLQPKEVVLTFDDGPEPGSTDAVLRTLEHHCTRATFFVVGRMAHANPGLVLAAEAAGHTIATHSHGHPLDLPRRPVEDGIREIESGIRDVTAALGHAPAPFFRFPGLLHTPGMRAYLADHSIAAISIDAEGGDWFPFASAPVVRQRALSQLRRANGGILLLHDTKSATVAMLPQLLADLRAEGFSIVHIVPSQGSLVAAAAARPGSFQTAKRLPPATSSPPSATLAAAPAKQPPTLRASGPAPFLFPWQRPQPWR